MSPQPLKFINLFSANEMIDSSCVTQHDKDTIVVTAESYLHSSVDSFWFHATY